MSYNISEAYFTASQANPTSVVLAVLHTTLGYHVFHDGICAAINLPTASPYHLGARLARIEPLVETLLPDPADLFAGYTQTELADCAITLRADDDDFAEFLYTLGFLTASLTIAHGYLTTPWADMLTLFTGTVQREALDDDGLHILGVRA